MNEALLDKNKEKSALAINKSLFDKSRLFALLSSSFAIGALVPAIIDYETTYDPDRDFNTCKTKELQNLTLRWAILWLSLTAIVLIIPYRYYFVRWQRHVMVTYAELPALRTLGFYEIIERCREPRWSDYITPKIAVSVVLYLIFPYPNMLVEVYVPQVMIETTEICYYLSEFFLALMFLRFIAFLYHLCDYSKYQTLLATRHCERYGVVAKPSFTLKCYLNERPVATLAFLLIIPAVIALAFLIRIFERPAHLPGYTNNLDSIQNGMWCVFITMSTVGYGDIYPVTMVGRVFGCLAALWGGIVLSMIFATAQAFLTLGENERKAYGSIVLSAAAAKAIVRSLKYSQMPAQRHPVEEINDWDRVRSALVKFKELKNQHSLEEDEGERMLNSVDKRLSQLEGEVKTLNEGIAQLLASLPATSINSE